MEHLASPPNRRVQHGTAGAAGAGCGTLLTLWVSSLPQENGAKLPLLLLVPTVSVLLGAGWLWCQAEVSRYVREKKLRSIAAAARETLEDALRDPNIDQAHRQKLQSKLQELNLHLADERLNELHSLLTLQPEAVQRA
ncbi:MAG: hypothetical protein JWM27_2039 [Gemmatimonadetes bacterium]|nr:hypothetical protein [Gemmatimonadota bacterium]